MTTPTKPVQSLRRGMLQAAIWRNENEHGVYYAATFERSFKNADDQWQSSATFGRDDLLLLAKLADEAHTAIFKLQEQERAKPAGRSGEANGSLSRSR